MAVNVRRLTMADAVQPRISDTLWDIGLVLAFGTLMGVLARISIPLPFTPVPLTGQTFGMLLTGALLGSRRGAAAMLVYLIEGVAGLPVFALGHSGWATLAGPTGGYLLAAPLTAFVVGFFAEHGWDRTFWRAVVAMVVGEVIIYALGVSWLAHFVGPSQAIPLGLLPFLPGDVMKLLLAAALVPSGWLLLQTLRPDRP